MGFNPIAMVGKSIGKILRKKTNSMIKTKIEDRIMNTQETRSEHVSDVAIGTKAEEEELCHHGYFSRNCPYCPPAYSVAFHDPVNELKHGWLVILEGLQKGRYFPVFSQFENKIGIAKECDIVLIGNNIAPFHSTIYYNRKMKKFMLKDLSPELNHSTMVNGESVPYEGDGVPLVDHMKIQFGDQVVCRFKCILD